MGLNYTENKYNARVHYKENDRDNPSQADYKVSNFSQTAKGQAYQLAEDFFTITSDLKLQLNQKGQVTEILNIPEIFQRWQEHKPQLQNKYKNIPDIDLILDNYEKNIQDKDKLRDSISYQGITRIFFTGVKGIIKK